MQEDRAAIQRDLGWLEKWPVRKSMNFGKDKCEKISTSPAPGKEEPSATVQTGGLGSSFAGKDMGSCWPQASSVSWKQRRPRASRNQASSPRKGIICFCSATYRSVSSFGSPNARKTSTNCSKFSGGHQVVQEKLQHLLCEDGLIGQASFSLEKKQVQNTSAYRTQPTIYIASKKTQR